MFGTLWALFGEILGNHKKMYVNKLFFQASSTTCRFGSRRIATLTSHMCVRARLCLFVPECAVACKRSCIKVARCRWLRPRASPTADYRSCQQRRLWNTGRKTAPKCDEFIPRGLMPAYRVSCLCSIDFMCYFCLRVDWICGCTCQFVIHVFEGCRAAVALGY